MFSQFAIRVPQQVYDAMISGIVLIVGAVAQLIVFEIRGRMKRIEHKLDANTRETTRAANISAQTRTQLAEHDREMKARASIAQRPATSDRRHSTTENLNT